MHQVQKPKTIRELGSVDIAEVKDTLFSAPEKLWVTQDAVKENNFSCFHHTRHIVLRFIRGNRNHLDFYDNPGWFYFESVLRPIFDRVVKPYGFVQPEYPKAMFARLQAGHQIDRHVDGAGSNLHTHKIHIPLQTNANVLFSVADRWFHLQEGIAYEVNNIAPHSVRNQSDQDRIHLIFEVFDAASAEVA
jgi:hypothetical protein